MGRPWAVDLTDAEQNATLPKPPGFSSDQASSHDTEDRVTVPKKDQTQLKLKKAKELAWSPGKNFMMTGFMLARHPPPRIVGSREQRAPPTDTHSPGLLDSPSSRGSLARSG